MITVSLVCLVVALILFILAGLNVPQSPHFRLGWFGLAFVALAMILALQQRRSPQSSVAWILSIVLVPYVAVPLFLVLGVRKRGRRFAPIDFSDMATLPEDASLTARAFKFFSQFG